MENITNGILTLTRYEEAYGFSLPERKVSNEKVADVELLRSRLDVERYQLRRQVFEKLISTRRTQPLTFSEVTSKLAGELIYLPLHALPSLAPRGGWCVLGLYIGGIEQRIDYLYGSGRPGGPKHFQKVEKSLYVGDLPEWVAERYEEAKKYVKVSDLLVVSRDAALFDVERVTSPRSPLLIVADRKVVLNEDGNPKVQQLHYLIAAWGLEHELPQSLGGLLPE